MSGGEKSFTRKSINMKISHKGNARMIWLARRILHWLHSKVIVIVSNYGHSPLENFRRHDVAKDWTEGIRVDPNSLIYTIKEIKEYG